MADAHIALTVAEARAILRALDNANAAIVFASTTRYRRSTLGIGDVEIDIICTQLGDSLRILAERIPIGNGGDSEAGG